MHNLVFSKFKDSKLAKINREIPKWLILNTLGIIREPLSFLVAMGVRFYRKEDLISIKEIRGEKNYFYDRVFKSRSSIVRAFSSRNNNTTENCSKNLENQDILKDLIGKKFILQGEDGDWFKIIHFREEVELLIYIKISWRKYKDWKFNIEKTIVVI